MEMKLTRFRVECFTLCGVQNAQVLLAKLWLQHVKCTLSIDFMLLMIFCNKVWMQSVFLFLHYFIIFSPPCFKCSYLVMHLVRWECERILWGGSMWGQRSLCEVGDLRSKVWGQRSKVWSLGFLCQIVAWGVKLFVRSKVWG